MDTTVEQMVHTVTMPLRGGYAFHLLHEEARPERARLVTARQNVP